MKQQLYMFDFSFALSSVPEAGTKPDCETHSGATAGIPDYQTYVCAKGHKAQMVGMRLRSPTGVSNDYCAVCLYEKLSNLGLEQCLPVEEQK